MTGDPAKLLSVETKRLCMEIEKIRCVADLLITSLEKICSAVENSHPGGGRGTTAESTEAKLEQSITALEDLTAMWKEVKKEILR